MANDKDELKGFTKADLIEVLTAAMSAANKPNAIETKALEEQVARERRRSLMMCELGKIEEEQAQRKKHGCSHSRHAQGTKMGGHACAKGQGEWCTGGQMLTRDKALLICTRCSYTWQWKPTEQELQYIENVGMLGMAPPVPARVIQEG